MNSIAAYSVMQRRGSSRQHLPSGPWLKKKKEVMRGRNSLASLWTHSSCQPASRVVRDIADLLHVTPCPGNTWNQQHSSFKDPYVAKRGLTHPELSLPISCWHHHTSFCPDKHQICHSRAPEITFGRCSSERYPLKHQDYSSKQRSHSKFKLFIPCY